MTGRAARGAIGARNVLAAAAALAGVLLTGCATGGDGRPGTASHPCDGGAPETVVLQGGGFGDTEPPPDAQEFQFAAEDAIGRLTEVAGDRLAGVWLEWEPRRQLVLSLTAGDEVPGLQAAADAAGVDVDLRYAATVGRSALLAAASTVGAEIHSAGVPGVSGSAVDEVNGRLVLQVASADDGGAATCAALRAILDEAGVPYAFEVFDGPAESTQRVPVPLSSGPGPALDPASTTFDLTAGSCNGEPEVTLLEQTDHEIRLEVTATVPAPGWGGDACLDMVTVALDQPLGDRVVVDLSTGDVVVPGVPASGS